MGTEPTVVRLESRIEERRYRPPFGEYLGGFFDQGDCAASLILEIELDDGSRGSGEATLLPAWSGETPCSGLALLDDVLRPAVEGRPAEQAGEEARAALAANGYLLWALEAAIVDALGGTTTTNGPVPIRGLIGPFDPDTSAALAEIQVGQGYRRLKVKLSGTLAEDEARLQAVREAAPEATLIVDANEAIAYSDLSRYAKLVGAMQIAAVEQPCPRADVLERGLPDAEGWLWVADESIWGIEDGLALRSGPWHVWTLHPGKCRGERALGTVVEIACEHGIAVVIGSNLHFDRGVQALCRIASSLPASPIAESLGHDIPAPVVYEAWSDPGVELLRGALRQVAADPLAPGGSR
jgi:muconate cycloisomerase